MASLEGDVQATESAERVPLATATSCCPGCCDDAECASTEAPCC